MTARLFFFLIWNFREKPKGSVGNEETHSLACELDTRFIALWWTSTSCHITEHLVTVTRVRGRLSRSHCGVTALTGPGAHLRDPPRLAPCRGTPTLPSPTLNPSRLSRGLPFCIPNPRLWGCVQVPWPWLRFIRDQAQRFPSKASLFRMLPRWPRGAGGLSVPLAQAPCTFALSARDSTPLGTWGSFCTECSRGRHWQQQPGTSRMSLTYPGSVDSAR